MKFRVWPTTIYFRAFQRCGGYNSASLFPQVDVVIRHPQVFGICEFSQHHNHGRYFWTRVRCGGASFWIRPLIQQLFSCPSLNYSKLVKGRKKNLRERHTLPERLKKNRNKKTQNSKHFMMWAFWVFYPSIIRHHRRHRNRWTRTPAPWGTWKDPSMAWPPPIAAHRIGKNLGHGCWWHLAPPWMITSFCETWTNVITYPKIEVIPSSQKRCGGKTSPKPIYLTSNSDYSIVQIISDHIGTYKYSHVLVLVVPK